MPQVEGATTGASAATPSPTPSQKLVEREERALYPERREQIRDLLFAQFSKNLPLLPLLFLADRIVADPHLARLGGRRRRSTFATTLERWYFAAPAPREQTAKGQN